MIDASRLSHSLATALKDRPHGIPIQPNRSLPLRPPPPPPTRVSVSKSPKNSPTSQTNTQETGRTGYKSVASPDEDAAKKGAERNENLPSLGVVGINFYDSKGEEEEEEEEGPDDKHEDKLSPIISKGIGRSRHAKSLDDYGSDKSDRREDRRRKSSDWEGVHRNSINVKKRNTTDFGSAYRETDGKIAKKDKERRGKKRKASCTEENYDLFGKPKSPRVLNSDAARPVGKPKTVSHNEDRDRDKNLIPKSKYITDRVESSAMELPIIYKYRNFKTTSPCLVEKNTQFKAPDSGDVTFGRKQTNSNTCKPILPKPVNIIPKCPVAIPIEVAHAMNQGNLRNSNRIVGKNGIKSPTSQSGSIKPKNNAEPDRTNISQIIDDVENALPSMPSLEDMMQSETLIRKKLTTLNEEVQKTESNSGMKPRIEPRVQQISDDSLSKTSSVDDKEVSQENTSLVHDLESDEPHESIVNLTTVLEIQTPGHSPKFIILKAPQIVASDKVDGMINQSPPKATTPVLLSSLSPSNLEEPRMIREAEGIDAVNGYGKDNREERLTSQEKKVQDSHTLDIGLSTKLPLSNVHRLESKDLQGKEKPRYTLKRKSPVEFEVSVKDISDLSLEQKSEEQPEIPKEFQIKPKCEDILRSRRIKLNLKLQKHHREEAHLKYKMSQTSDLSRLTRLQQKINCAKKKIENTRKYLSKLFSIENPGLDANPPQLRIQVRRDLVQKLPSLGSAESDSQSALRSTNEIDDSTGRSSPISPPLVITITETDSASSDDETDTSDEKSPNNLKLDTETKFKYESITDDEGQSYPSDSLLDDKAKNIQLKVSPEATNNNVEYINKNLVPVREVVSENVNTLAAISSPGIPTNLDTVSKNIPRVPTNPNNIPSSIPQISTSVITAPISIPPLIRDPIDYSLNKLNDFVHRKSPSAQYGVPNLNLPPNKVDNEQKKQNCNCLSCLRGTLVTAIKKTAQFDASQYIPNTANDLRTPSTIRRTAVKENTNVNPVPNYPVHRTTDYRTSGNVPSMFSRDNGGANINLSSPLQGHSAMSLPPHYYRNLTAQGYPLPAEPSPNQQTPQWHGQQPQSKSSVPLTPEQETPLHSSILASHLLKPHVPDPANFPNSNKLSSLAQSKDTTTINSAKRVVGERVMNAQFPTLGNWAAQINRESTTSRRAPSNSATDRTAYKTTGSDMYKMAATAIDPTHPPNSATKAMHWSQSGRPCPAEQPRSSQGYPSQRNIPPYSYRRDYLTSPQNPAKAPVTYPGSEVFVAYPTNPYHHQVPSGPQNTRSNERSGGQTSQHLQNARQYQLPAQSAQPTASVTNYQKNSPQLNPMGFIPNQYLQQSPSYVQAMLSQWQSASNYQNNYISPQYNNGYNLQSKTMEHNSGLYRTTGKNIAPMPQPQVQHNIAGGHLAQNIPNAKLPSSVYGTQANNLNQGIGAEGRNGETFDIGRSYVAPQLEKVQRSLDRSSIFQCSRCGKPGPNFNCFGCEIAFYCDEYCQSQHWSKHFIECSKKMPKLKKVS